MRPVLVLRPEPGNAATCIAARERGLAPRAVPLFAFAPLNWTVPAGVTWHGLLIGSAAVMAHGGPDLGNLRAVPVHAVGPTTARAAQAAGFRVAATGSGGLQTLVSALPPGRYLRLAGKARVALVSPPGVTIDDVVVYAARPQPLDPATVALLRQHRVVALLHSGEAARHFADQCTAHRLPRGQIALACLAPRIAQAAGADWQAVASAQRPDDDAVLSLALQMCQTL
jgi:uroporphyrinogen-III synthase